MNKFAEVHRLRAARQPQTKGVEMNEHQSEQQKPGQGQQKPGEQKPGQQKPGEQRPGEHKPGEKETD